MKYKEIPVSESFWRAFLNKSLYATFYHSDAWVNILSGTFPKWQNATFAIEFEDGNQVIFPLMRRSLFGNLPFYWYESTAPGAYGGPIFLFPPLPEHEEALHLELAKLNNILIVANPFSAWQPDDSFQKYETFIQVLNLTSDFKQIWRAYSKGRRHTIKYAQKEGLIAKQVDFLEHYKTYYEIYQTQLKRWGRKATDYYPLRLFQNLALSAKENPNIKLWTVWLDAKMISGLVVFYHNKHLVTWHGATLDEYFKYRPVDILYSAVIEDACTAGFEIFDFANSGGHESVVEYKERFGATRLPLTIYRRRNLGGLFYRATRQFRNFFRLCPED